MSSKAEADPTEPIEIAEPADLDDALSTYDIVLVDFYADWCGPCKMMEPIVESIASDTDAVVVEVDVDRFQHLASEHGVQGIPTLLLYSDGEVVERFVGAQSEESVTTTFGAYTE
ncbi:MAG: thioredoxin family protein [Halovenus sp.]